MEDNSVEETEDKRPSWLRVVLWVAAVIGLVAESILLLLDGEWLMAVSLLLWGGLSLLAFHALNRKKDALFSWPLWLKCFASFLGLSGALGMLIQSINLGMMATYFANPAWWVAPASLLCLVLTFFLPAVVVLIWVAQRD